MELSKEEWGTYRGHIVHIYTVKDTKNNFSVGITELGASLLRILLPDKNGVVGDIALTQYTPKELVEKPGYLGQSIGRFGNRINHAKFELDGIEHRLNANSNGHCLHGGKEGFNQKVWTLLDSKVSESEVILHFQYISPDAEENFPGELKNSVIYNVSPLQISWEFLASTNRATTINLTNHAYWNLDGLETTIDHLSVQLKATHYMPINQDGSPTGEVVAIEAGSALDLSSPKPIEQVFKDFGDVDNNFFINGRDANPKGNKKGSPLHSFAQVFSPKTGRFMEIQTTEPCFQFYTGNFLHEVGTVNGHHKADKHYAFCMEKQSPPKAINLPQFRDWAILKPRDE
eukprot:TRINITY_DN5425_c0_g1_i1.p1 TRINITY_DN5425_c0_g1~~TRINITY_DN5425_c0_g1_i1.p1  ORF type:complete len:373 (+),score=87.56 TRINITY_DN5425_c0_g1_i1:88-1119(+)